MSNRHWVNLMQGTIHTIWKTHQHEFTILILPLGVNLEVGYSITAYRRTLNDNAMVQVTYGTSFVEWQDAWNKAVELKTDLIADPQVFDEWIMNSSFTR